MENIFNTSIETPIGSLEIISNKNFIISIRFVDSPVLESKFIPDILQKATLQLEQYFTGDIKEFNLEIQPVGSDFQQKVWKEVKKIPFGKTVSYLDIAIQTGSKNNTRAVGLANGKNPVPIVIPCHRVIGTNGKLTGYAGGLERKKWLLQHEMKHSKPVGLLF
jgi:methylated-DNA-[protein]-cysteine S-methyltransferase